MNPVFIMLEVGSNHQGSLNLAKSYIEQAKIVGANACKFQLIKPFQKSWIPILKEECDRFGVEFMATPFNQEGVSALKGYVNRWKIASTEAADVDFVLKVLDAAGQAPVYISDGAVNAVTYNKQYLNLIPLACVVKYPAQIMDYTFDGYVSLDTPWGLSDHTSPGSLLPELAVAAGATVIEKHLTLNKNWEGPDHNFACEPKEFASMVQNIRLIEKLLTNKKTTITDYVGRTIEWP